MRLRGRNAGAGQEVAQSDQLPDIGEVFVRRPLHGVGLSIERQEIGAVVSFRDRANRLQQAHQVPPLQVMRHRVLEDNVQGALVFSAQMRSRHTSFTFGGAAVPRSYRALRPATQCGGRHALSSLSLAGMYHIGMKVVHLNGARIGVCLTRSARTDTFHRSSVWRISFRRCGSPAHVRELRALIAHRQRLMGQHTMAKNRLRSLLIRHNLTAPATNPFSEVGAAQRNPRLGRAGAPSAPASRGWPGGRDDGSDGRSRFVECMLTVSATCQLRQRPRLPYLVAATTASGLRRLPRELLPSETS